MLPFHFQGKSHLSHCELDFPSQRVRPSPQKMTTIRLATSRALGSHLWPASSDQPPRPSPRDSRGARAAYPQPAAATRRFCSGSRGGACLIRAPLPSPPVVISVQCGRQLHPGGPESCARRLPSEANVARGGRGGIPRRTAAPHHAAPREGPTQHAVWPHPAPGCSGMRFAPARQLPPVGPQRTGRHVAPARGGAGAQRSIDALLWAPGTGGCGPGFIVGAWRELCPRGGR